MGFILNGGIMKQIAYGIIHKTQNDPIKLIGSYNHNGDPAIFWVEEDAWDYLQGFNKETQDRLKIVKLTISIE